MTLICTSAPALHDLHVSASEDEAGTYGKKPKTQDACQKRVLSAVHHHYLMCSCKLDLFIAANAPQSGNARKRDA